MASPFSIFRRHQKMLLATLGIMAMVSFVILPIIAKRLGAFQTRNPVRVSTTRFGDLTLRDLRILSDNQSLLLGVWQRILARRDGVESIAPYREFVQRLFGGMGEEELVNSWLLGRYAEQMGFRVSDETVNQFLRSLTHDRLKAEDFHEIIIQHRLTDKYFFQLMREALAKRQLIAVFQQSIGAFPPAQRWDLYRRTRVQASIEYVALPVEQFVDRVKEKPSEAELESFFERYKEKIPLPVSPEPGFRMPKKIEVEYFQAERAAFAAPESVSEEEIQDQYEKRRKHYDKLNQEFSLRGERDLSNEKEEPSDTDAETEQEVDETETPPAGDAALTPSSSPEKPQQAGTDAPPPERANPPEPPAPEAAPDGETPLSSESAAPPESPSEAPSAAEDATPPAKKPEVAAPPRRELAEEVRAQIRRDVAMEKILKKFSELRKIMEENGREWNRYEAARIREEPISKPKKLGFAGLAKQYGFTSDSTGLVSQWETGQKPIGRSWIIDGGPFTLYAFESLGPYRTEISSAENEGQWFLFWKIKETKEHTPEFDDPGVRDRVLRAWRLVRARKLALEEARRLAAEARKTKTSLQETFAGKTNLKVVAPPAFSWLTTGGLPRDSVSFVPGDVEGVPFPGNDFMQAVFALEKDEVGVAMNQPKTEVYVVRIDNLEPSATTLWEGFKADDFSTYAPAAQDDLEDTVQTWLKELQADAGLKWEPLPEQKDAGEQRQ